MYPLDEPDRILERFDVPLACTAEPRLCVLADGNFVSVAYATQKGANEPNRAIPLFAIITFINCISYQCGGPGAKSISEHLLYGKGLEPYSFSEVVNPRRAERRFILSLRDATFECAAAAYSFTLYEGTGEGLIAKMRERHALLFLANAGGS